MEALVRRFGPVIARIKALETKKVPEAASLRKAAAAAGYLAKNSKGIKQAMGALDQVESRIDAVERRLEGPHMSGGEQTCKPVDKQEPNQSIAPDVAGQSSTGSSGLIDSGARPTEEPVSLSVGGLPAFRYNAPNIPVASATIVTPTATVELTLSLRGSVTVSFPNSPPGISTDIDRGGWRVESQRALGPLTQGFRVNGLGTDRPSVGATMGTRYNSTEYRLEPPSSMLFIGQGRVDYAVPSRLGNVSVQGQLGFELKVSVIPNIAPRPRVPVQIRVPRTKDSWFSEHSTALSVLGVVALVALVVATDGFGLIAIEGLEAGGGAEALLGSAAL